MAFPPLAEVNSVATTIVGDDYIMRRSAERSTNLYVRLTT